jgi:hypothetical protein
VNRVKVFVRVTGAILLILGAICMPIGFGVNPKRDQSIFNNLADMGVFVRWGAILAGCGLILVVAASLLPASPDNVS